MKTHMYSKLSEGVYFTCPRCGLPLLDIGHGEKTVCRRCGGIMERLGNALGYKEKTMEKYVKFKKEDVQKAYDEGCEDVQSTLRKMCPEIFEKKYCCDWMKETIKHGLIKDVDGKHHRFAYNQDALTAHMYENVIYYCPRCGKKGKQ